MKRVFHIINGLGPGGAEGVLVRLCLNESKYVHAVINLGESGKNSAALERAEIKIYCAEDGSAGYIKKLFFVLDILKREKPDVVQTWMYHADLIGGFAARFAGVSCIFWGLRDSLEGGGDSLLKRWLLKATAELSFFIPTKIIACSDRVKFTHIEAGYCHKKLVTVRNGYDLRRLFPATKKTAEAYRKSLNIGDGIFLIGCVARFTPKKNHRKILAALAMLKGRGFDIHCVFAGASTGSENNELAKLVADHKLSSCVSLVGELDKLQVLMSAIDIHLLASSREGFPNVIAEAMACGTPCVSSDVGEAREIIGDTGWIINGDLAHHVADAIELAIAAYRTTSWSVREQAARSRIKTHYSVETMCQNFGAVWAGYND